MHHLRTHTTATLFFNAAARETHIVVKCLGCGSLKRFLARKDYQLSSDSADKEPLASVEQSNQTEIPDEQS